MLFSTFKSIHKRYKITLYLEIYNFVLVNILFLCVGNSARSQIAEGIAKSIFGKNHCIKSAGSQPVGIIHPEAILTMQDIGIDITNQKSKSIDSLEIEFMKNIDYVITLCAEEICPVLPGDSKSFHWMNEDPVNNKYSEAELKIAFKHTRDNIFKLIKSFYISENL